MVIFNVINISIEMFCLFLVTPSFIRNINVMKEKSLLLSDRNKHRAKRKDLFYYVKCHNTNVMHVYI